MRERHEAAPARHGPRRGETPAGLPTPAPVKEKMPIDRKSANALGIDIPGAALARAHEVSG